MFPPGGPYPHPEPAEPARDPGRDPAQPDPAQPDPPPPGTESPGDQVAKGLVGGQEVDLILHDSVLRHRALRLARAGLNPRQSRALAIDRRVDVHWVEDRLLKRGCPPDIAYAIAAN